MMTQTSYPASFAQQRLWFLDQLEPGAAAYNLVRAFRITGLLDINALTSAIRAVVRRHESLRTVFEMVEGETRQVVLSNVDIQVSLVDVTHLPSGDRRKAALRIASEEGKIPFDLTRGPLLRAFLVRIDQDQHLLVLAMHHIVTDGWSISILFRELARSYEAFVKGEEPQLPELPLQYAEYAQWQRESISGEILAKQVAYWKNKLTGAQTILDLPADHPRPLIHSWHGATEELILDSRVLAELKQLAQQEGATLFMVSMAVFQALLWRYTGQDSILVGTPTAARSQVEIENLIGFFVNTLVFRADFTDTLTFRDLVRQVRDCALDAYAHQDVPFEKLVEELAPERSMDTTPLFQVMFTFQNIPKQIFEISGLEMEELEFETGIAKFDLSVELYEDRDFHCRFEYNSDLFEKPTILRTLGHFRNLVNAALKNPDQLLSQMPLMNSGEREQILVEWNDTAADYLPTLRLHTAFELQAASTPKSAALRFQGSELTYHELNERSNQLAHYLMKKGLQTGMLAGVSIKRSPEMVIALLAVLKTGAAYLPLDPSYPAERLRFMVEDAQAACVVTHSGIRNNLPDSVRNVIVLDSEAELIKNESSDNPSLELSSMQRAYVLYTSGTSGGPKGVEGTHGGAINRLWWMWERYPFHGGEVCCQKTNLGFVDSVWEIFGPLLAGIPSVILGPEVVRDPEQLLQSLAENQVTRMVLVPSLLRALLDHAPHLQERVPQLKLWSSSGEVLSGELVGRFRQGFPEATLLNIYGATEVAADVTWHEVGEEDVGVGTVPIGRPISNTQVYVLDGHGNPVPAGVRGEIYVGGEGLALGYWNRRELTEERFVENRIAPEESARLYRTGDLGRWRGDGEMEYVGRVDGEVKLRGMRIDLGEIEAALLAHVGVREAAVERVEEAGGEARLQAYVVAAEGERANARELRQHLRRKLPEHMVPARFVELEQFPRLASGKVNRRELAAAGGRRIWEQGMAVPGTVTERALAEIWKELLKVEEVGVEQNFFELGGHSLLVLQVMARIRRKFGLELPVRTVFEEPTIAGLATAVEKAQALGLNQAHTPILQSRSRAAEANASQAMRLIQSEKLSQLEKLSAEEARNLLRSLLDGKQDYELRS
jgi:amino acid adenylation domain-containing protein